VIIDPTIVQVSQEPPHNALKITVVDPDLDIGLLPDNVEVNVYTTNVDDAITFGLINP
jgi:hypothetical protein